MSEDKIGYIEKIKKIVAPEIADALRRGWKQEDIDRVITQAYRIGCALESWTPEEQANAMDATLSCLRELAKAGEER